MKKMGVSVQWLCTPLGSGGGAGVWMYLGGGSEDVGRRCVCVGDWGVMSQISSSDTFDHVSELLTSDKWES